MEVALLDVEESVTSNNYSWESMPFAYVVEHGKGYSCEMHIRMDIFKNLFPSLYEKMALLRIYDIILIRSSALEEI